MEQWKDVPGYGGLYQVSNFGNVRSLNWGNRGFVRNLFLKPHNRGYLQVELHKNGNRKMFTVHRLVAVAYVSGFREDYVVNHLDENKQNNRAENLEWCAPSENVRFSIDHRVPVLHRKYPKFRPRKDTQAVFQTDMSNRIVRKWESIISVKEALGYNDWSIRQCCRGNRKSAYGYKWRYATLDNRDSEIS